MISHQAGHCQVCQLSKLAVIGWFQVFSSIIRMIGVLSGICVVCDAMWALCHGHPFLDGVPMRSVVWALLLGCDELPAVSVDPSPVGRGPSL